MGTFSALEGLAEFNGAKPPPAGPPPAKVDELLLRFPDAPKARRG